jgi:putative NADPH-quinone reductase
VVALPHLGKTGSDFGVGRMFECLIPVSDGVEVCACQQASHFVRFVAQYEECTGVGYWQCDDHALCVELPHGADRGAHFRARRSAVVNENHNPTADVDWQTVVPIKSFAALELDALPRDLRLQRRGALTGSKDPVGDDDDPAGGEGTDCQRRFPRHAELMYDHDVKRCVQRLSEFHGDGHAAARKSENENVLTIAIVSQQSAERVSGHGSIEEWAHRCESRCEFHCMFLELDMHCVRLRAFRGVPELPRVTFGLPVEPHSKRANSRGTRRLLMETPGCIGRAGTARFLPMSRNILILDGHPDASAPRFVHALAAAYQQGAVATGHQVHVIKLAELEFPLLRSQADYEKGEAVEAVRRCQDLMNWATHVVILYPLWLGSMPALLKALLEQMLRPGFAFSTLKLGRWPVKFMSGKSARIVVTMGMPAFWYRWYFRAHSLRSLQRNILRFVGFRRIRATIVGSVASLTRAQREAWLEDLRALGRDAA